MEEADLTRWLLSWIPMVALLATFVWSILVYKKTVQGKQTKSMGVILEDQNTIQANILAEMQQINATLKQIAQNNAATKG